MGFSRTTSKGSRDADRNAAGEARLMFITLVVICRKSNTGCYAPLPVGEIGANSQ
jgi:hypothetical protein